MTRICRKGRASHCFWRAGAARLALQSVEQGRREFARQHLMASGAAARFRLDAPRPFPIKENGMRPKMKRVAI